MKQTFRAVIKPPSAKGGTINFAMTPNELLLIRRIVDRILIEFVYTAMVDEQQLAMDIAAANNATPLDLAKLLASEPTDFRDDIVGVRWNINRTTGRLMNGFIPKCAKR